MAKHLKSRKANLRKHENHRKNSRRESLVLPLIFALVLCSLIIPSSFYIARYIGIRNAITGNLLLPPLPPASGQGCCERFCSVTDAALCSGSAYHDGESCDHIESCNIGCCVDNEGYCLSNYLKSNCDLYSYEFVKKECSELPKCLSAPPKDSPRQRTGIYALSDSATDDFYSRVAGITRQDNRIVYDDSIDYGLNYGFVDPISAYQGSMFKIKYIVSDSKNIAKIEAMIKDMNGAQTIVELFDDGAHNDDAANDLTYGALWDSSVVQQSGINPYTMDFRITQTGGGIALQENVANFSVTKDVRCMPLAFYSDPSKTINIIMVGNNYGSSMPEQKIATDVYNHYSTLSITSPIKDSFDQVNFYRIDRNFNLDLNSDDIANQIKSECNFYDPSKDAVIIFDFNEARCRKIGENSSKIVAMNPNTITFYDSPYSMPHVISNFCSMMETLEQNQINALAQFSTAVFLTKDNQQFSNEVSVYYKITDKSDPEIPFTFFRNTDQLFFGKAKNGKVYEFKEKLDDGEYYYYITSSNSRNQAGYSSFFHFTVNSSLGFKATLISPQSDQIFTNNTFNVTLKAERNGYDTLDYDLLIDDKSAMTGTVNVNEPLDIPVSLPFDGNYSVVVRVTDAEGKSTESDRIPFQIAANVTG